VRNSRTTGVGLAWLAAGLLAGWAPPGRAADPPIIRQPGPDANRPGRDDRPGDRDRVRPLDDRDRRDAAGGRRPDAAMPVNLVVTPPSILGPNAQPIDLNTALRLAGVQNPELLLARQRVVESAALRMLAAAQILPTLNGGMNYDTHTGVLQQSNGNILSINRSAVYVGAGANAVAAGTVSIPGVVLTGNIAEGVYGFLTARQVVRQREFATLAIRNQTFLQVALAYSELTRAEGRRAVEVQAREQAREVARLTSEYAAAGEGRLADANRAATELARREANIQLAESEILAASARLCQLLNLDPSIRLHPTDALVVPMPIVPDPMPVAELIAIALLRRPELGERRAAIRESLLALEGAKVLPFSPTILVGFSAGGFGGGSNLVRPVFGGFAGRQDFDAMTYWTIRNLGVGNVALIRLADAHLQSVRFQELAVLNQVRAEVAEAYARTHARFNQIGTAERAVRSGSDAYTEDLERIRLRAERDVLPIELLNSFRLLSQARSDYLNAIVDYNEAQFALYVAMGQPPADALAHPVPTEGVYPSGPPPTPGNPAPRTAETTAPAPPPPPGPARPSPLAVPPGAAAPNPRPTATVGFNGPRPNPAGR
jgi:outer membrane protein TolC